MDSKAHQEIFESSKCRFWLATTSERSSWCKSFLLLPHYHPEIRLHHWPITRRLCFLCSWDLFFPLESCAVHKSREDTYSSDLRPYRFPMRSNCVSNPLRQNVSYDEFLDGSEVKIGMIYIMKTAQSLWLTRNGNWNFQIYLDVSLGVHFGTVILLLNFLLYLMENKKMKLWYTYSVHL